MIFFLQNYLYFEGSVTVLEEEEEEEEEGEEEDNNDDKFYGLN